MGIGRENIGRSCGKNIIALGNWNYGVYYLSARKLTAYAAASIAESSTAMRIQLPTYRTLHTILKCSLRKFNCN